MKESQDFGIIRGGFELIMVKNEGLLRVAYRC